MSGPVRIQEQNRKMKHTRAAVHLYLQTSLRLLIESFIIKAFAFGSQPSFRSRSAKVIHLFIFVCYFQLHRKF